MTDSPISIKQEINASIDKVWKAITDKNQMIKWYFENIPDFKPTVGFETRFNIHHNGKDYLHIWKVTDVIPIQKIVYNWKYEGYTGDSFVIWELNTEDNKTILKFSHHGQSSFPQDNPDFKRENCTQGWIYFIQERLKHFLDLN